MILNFEDDTFQAIDYTGTDNQTQGNKAPHTPETKKTNMTNKTNDVALFFLSNYFTIPPKVSSFFLAGNKRDRIETLTHYTEWSQFVVNYLLDRDAVLAQRPIVVKLSGGRSVGPSVRTYVPVYVRTYVRPSVCLSSVLRENGGSDPDAVWHHSFSFKLVK